MIAGERNEGTPASHGTERPPLASVPPSRPGNSITASQEGWRLVERLRWRVDEIVRQFHVHYEVRPESMGLGDHSIRQVGFCLELHARGGAESGGRLGDDRSKEAILGLLEISSFVVPAAEGDCCYEVSGSPAAFYNLGGPQGGQGCVRLDIRVLRREGWDRPVNGMDARALQEMEDRLRALGVPRGSAIERDDDEKANRR